MHDECFSSILATKPLCKQNDEWYVPYLKMSDKDKRVLILTAILELIKADISSKAGTNGSMLSHHLEQLDSYVDLLQVQLDK